MEGRPEFVPLAEPGGIPVPVVIGGLVFEVEAVEVDSQGRGEKIVVEGQVGVGIEAVTVVPNVGIVAAVAQAAVEFQGRSALLGVGEIIVAVESPAFFPVAVDGPVVQVGRGRERFSPGRSGAGKQCGKADDDTGDDNSDTNRLRSLTV